MATASAALFDSGKGGGAAVGEREDLSNVIAQIDPSEVPIYSMAKKGTAKAVFAEWQYQDLASAASDNYVNEGADANYASPTPTVRVGNYMQISQKAVSISETLEAVDKAGRAKETAYQKILKGKELKLDINKSLGIDQARAGSDPRKSAGLSSWITNVSVSAAGTASSAATGDGTDVPSLTGTDRALTLALIDEAMQAAYEDGGNPSAMVLSPTNKVNFSDLSSGSVAQNEYTMSSVKEGAIIGSVSLYLTDFGKLEVVIDRNLASDRIFLLDKAHMEVCTLPGRNFSVKPMGRTGDSTQFQMVTEWTLKVPAPKAHGAVFDLSGS